MRTAKNRMGIYSIECGKEGRVYVDASSNMGTRMRNHLMYLRNRKYETGKLTELQQDFDKYSEQDFKWRALKEVTVQPDLMKELKMAVEEYHQAGWRFYNSQYNFGGMERREVVDCPQAFNETITALIKLLNEGYVNIEDLNVQITGIQSNQK